MNDPRRTVVAIDCGSSAVRAYIAEIGPGERWRVLESLSRDVDLTQALQGGRLSRQAMDRVAHALADIMLAARSYAVTEVRAVATAALREASNTDVLLERLASTAGIEVEVIDSGEEVRLYHEALRRLLREEKRRLRGSSLLIDLGSGNSVAGLIRSGKLVHAVDEHFGTERMYHAFRDFHDADDFAHAVDRITHGAITMMLARMPRGRIANLVVTGTEVRNLVALLRREREQPLVELSRREVDEWWHELHDLTPTARAERCDCDIPTSGLLLLATAFLRQLMDVSGLGQVLVPQLRLRDGLMADMLPGAPGPHHLGRQQLLAAARDIARRFGMNRAYAENTAALAAQLFDQTAALHHYGARERTLLEFAAWVHDVGALINVRGRNKHSFYIIQALDIAGLTELLKQVLAHVARYHRRSEPKISHAAFQRLPRAQRVLVSHLAAILRLAYALDVERTQRIRELRCTVSDGTLIIQVDRREIALEQWALGGKSDMFGRVFGLSVKLMPRGED